MLFPNQQTYEQTDRDENTTSLAEGVNVKVTLVNEEKD